MRLTVALGLLALAGAGCAREPSRAAWVAGAPWAAHLIDGDGRGADGVRAADFDGDGRLDLVSPWEEQGEVRLYRNPGPEGARSPWPRTRVGRVGSPEDALPFDVDGDGRLDVVSATEGSTRTVFAHLRAPEAAEPWSDAAWATRAFAASAGRGGWLCVEPYPARGGQGAALVAGGNAGAPIALLEPPAVRGEVEDWTLTPLAAAGWAMSIEPADLDGDGDLDLLLADRDPPLRGVRWLERPPGGSAWGSRPLLASREAVFFLDASGLSPRGVGPVVATRAPRELARLELAAGRLRAVERVRLPDGVGVPKAVRRVDLDGDGVDDLAVSCEQATNPRRGVVWLRRTAAGWEVRDVSGPRGAKFDRLLPLDFDGDGDLDLATTEETRIGVVWYENPAR